MASFQRRWILLLFVCAFTVSVGAAQSRRPGSQPRATTKVIVTLLDGSDADSVLRSANIATTSRRFTRAINGFAADLDEAQLAALDADPRVVSINPNVTFTLAKIEWVGPQLLPKQIVTDPLKRIGIMDSPTARVDGRDDGGFDVDIAVVDSGVDGSHPDLRVAGGVNCIDSTSPSYDPTGHGTMVAGLAAAKDNGVGVVGVAPGARIWSVKVSDESGTITLEAFMCSLEWLQMNAPIIEVANMSLGIPGTVDGPCGLVPGPGRHPRWQKWKLVDPYNMAICKIVDSGTVIVASVGNDAVDAEEQLPAAYPQTLAVSALADHDGKPGGEAKKDTCFPGEIDDGLASFSNFGEVVDFAAPGICTISTFPGGYYRMGDGTSFAAPLVAGAAALVAVRHPGAAPSVIREILEANAERWHMPNDPDQYREAILSVRGF